MTDGNFQRLSAGLLKSVLPQCTRCCVLVHTIGAALHFGPPDLEDLSYVCVVGRERL